MEKVESGLFVSVDYTGKLHNGDVFDSSVGRQPLEVQTGSGCVLAGFESALMGVLSRHNGKPLDSLRKMLTGDRDDSRMHASQI